MKIKEILTNSIAEEIGLQVNDDLVKINDWEIHDIIDYRYYSSDEFLDIQIERNGDKIYFEIEKDFDEDLGIDFQPMKFRCCGNKCIFCFIDQNPPGMREPIYFKDEDYRLSFLHGNYVTLTNASKKDLARIAEQRLSPIYISVHSTDSKTRQVMLGTKKDDHILDKIKFLTDHKIQIHAQIVLCPGINDGESLKKTINGLAEFYPFLKSIAIVPVGLTKHRDGLFNLKPVTPKYANQFIPSIEQIAHNYKKTHDDYFVYLADEFYILANQELPAASKYEDFPQIENGVGMTRDFINQFEEQNQDFPHKIPERKSLNLITGTLAAPILNKYVVPVLRTINNLDVSLNIIKNEFYGNSASVTGLLTGQDIFNQLRSSRLGDILAMPANCLNHQGLFLDDWTIDKLEQKLNRKIVVVENDFQFLIETLN